MSKNADGTKNYVCKICHNSFKTNNNFVQHYKQVHLKQRPKVRACHLCDVKVPGYKRAFHMEEKHGLPAPRCALCGKKFGYPYQVVRHQRFYHLEERNYPCNTCDLKYPTLHQLKYHEVSHTASRPFICGYCEKSFKWKRNLKTHILIHLGQKTQECVFCKAAFVQQTSLKFHIMRNHSDLY